MALKFTLKTAAIPLTDNAEDTENMLTVRGLSLNDMTQLIVLHRETIEEVFNRFSGRDPATVTDGDAAQVISDMVESAPAVVAHIIALAADGLEQFDNFVALPAGVSVEALEKIGKLTFPTGGGAKKILGLVMKALPQRAKPQESLQT